MVCASMERAVAQRDGVQRTAVLRPVLMTAMIMEHATTEFASVNLGFPVWSARHVFAPMIAVEMEFAR